MRSEDRVARPGSSPLTRGKRGGGDPGVASGRLIPAHAGKTRQAARQRLPTQAHPRSRGENAVEAARADLSTGSSPLTRGKRKTVLMFFAMISGSSPLTRGKHLRARPISARLRLIPAHAGKTPNSASRRWAVPAHPRSRGENFLSSHLLIIGDGSSPLTRGKRRGYHLSAREVRLIPAHAGKTSRPSSRI